MSFVWILAALSLQAGTSYARPSRVRRDEPDPIFAVPVEVGGKTYINKVRPTLRSWERWRSYQDRRAWWGLD